MPETLHEQIAILSENMACTADEIERALAAGAPTPAIAASAVVLGIEPWAARHVFEMLARDLPLDSRDRFVLTCMDAVLPFAVALAE